MLSSHFVCPTGLDGCVSSHHWGSMWAQARVFSDNTFLSSFFLLFPTAFSFTPLEYIRVFKYTISVNMEFLFKSPTMLYFFTNDHKTKEKTSPRAWNTIDKNANRLKSRSMILYEASLCDTHVEKSSHSLLQALPVVNFVSKASV